MKKTFCFFAVAVFVFGAAEAFAANSSVNQNSIREIELASPEVKAQNQATGQSAATPSASPQTAQDSSKTQSQIKNQDQIKNQGEEDQIKNQEQEELQEQNLETGEQRRSSVANFVQVLLKTASTTKAEVGQQVRVIAQQQSSSEATTTAAIEKIQSRSKIKTFLIGSDYKNLGALRSEMVQTRNRIEQLNRVLQSASNMTEVQAQIQTLEQEQIKLNNFIKEQEDKFSLFGWLVKIFNK